MSEIITKPKLLNAERKTIHDTKTQAKINYMIDGRISQTEDRINMKKKIIFTV